MPWRLACLAAAADGAGVIGAVLAALCCARTPIIVGAVIALGLGFLRDDAVLRPVMLASLGIARWGFWRGQRCHGQVGSLLLGVAGAVSMASGVILVHGFLAMQMIYASASALVVGLAMRTSKVSVTAARRCGVLADLRACRPTVGSGAAFGIRAPPSACGRLVDARTLGS